ncbi:MAG: class I SAM-dependent methyltransferase [Ktedonobacterales bacterium]|jgi:SAM-dependent methyltransferase
MRWFGWFRRKPQVSAQWGAINLNAVTNLVAGRERVVGLPYALPADGEEVNRLDFQHYMLRFAFQGNFAAPVGRPTSILDVGTGTGRWAIEMAQTFPDANVIGLDVKPPAMDERAERRPDADVRPPNYTFVAGNLFEGLPFGEKTFDFVHQRLLFTAIPHGRWAWVASELMRVTRPGGWVELVDCIGLANGGPNVEQLMNWIRQLSAKREVDLNDGGRLAEALGSTPLRNQASRRIDLPTGAYGGRLGRMVATDFVSVCKGFGGVAVAQGICSQPAWDLTLENMQLDLAQPDNRCVTPFFIAYGQRP